MELLERYVAAVSGRLHPSRRAKVEAELRAAILDALEARGGSAADEATVVAVLAEFGAPERMAAEYEPGRQYLIGPDLYPHFRRGLRVALVAVFAASAFGFGISLLLGGLAGFQAGGVLVRTLAYAFAATLVATVLLVAVFAWLQRSEQPVPDMLHGTVPAWDPRSLPDRTAHDDAPRSEAVGGLVAAAVALVIVGVIGRVARDVEPLVAPALHSLIRDGVVRNVMFIQLALVLSAVAHGVALLQRHWQPWTRGVRLAADAIAVVVFTMLPFQLLASRPALLEAGVDRNAVNWLVANAFVFGAIVIGGATWYWLRTWRRTRTRRARHAVVSAAILAAAALPMALSGCAMSSASPHGRPAAGEPLPDALGPRAAAPAGEVRRHTYHSARFDEARELWVYTPPGYDAAAARRYPVLYLLHGVGDDARSWSVEGNIRVLLDDLIVTGAAVPMIVAMPLGYGFPDGAARARELLSPATDHLAVVQAFTAGLIEEVLPFVQRHFRAHSTREARGIAGLSMGGSQALYIGLNHADHFGHVASFGGALIMYGGRYGTWFPGVDARAARSQQQLRISVGVDDFLLGMNRHFAQWLAGHGFDVRLEEVPGDHSWHVWRQELVRLAPLLFRETITTSDEPGEDDR